MAMADWSIDAGIGIDDYAAFISDQGEVALYKGSDPTSATTWALVGTFWVGARSAGAALPNTLAMCSSSARTG
jgi:hypothetical protein